MSNEVTPKNNNWVSTQVTQTHTHHIMVHEDRLYSYYMIHSYICNFHIQIMEVQMVHDASYFEVVEVYCKLLPSSGYEIILQYTYYKKIIII